MQYIVYFRVKLTLLLQLCSNLNVTIANEFSRIRAFANTPWKYLDFRRADDT